MTLRIDECSAKELWAMHEQVGDKARKEIGAILMARTDTSRPAILNTQFKQKRALGE